MTDMSESSMDVDSLYFGIPDSYDPRTLSSGGVQSIKPFSSPNLVRQSSSSEIKLADTLQTKIGINVFADTISPPPTYGSPRYRWPEVDELEINDMFPEGCTPHFTDQQLQSLAMMYGIPRIVSGLAPTDVEADAHNNTLLNLAHWNIPQQPDGDPTSSDECVDPFIITPPLGLESSKTLARRILEGHIQSDSRVDSPGPFYGRADTFSASANHCVMQLEAMVISDEENDSDEDGEWVAGDGEDAMDMTEPHTTADTSLLSSIKRKRPQRRDTGDSASSERPTKTMRRTAQVGVQRTRRHR